MGNWKFASGDNETTAIHSEKVARDAEQGLIYAPLMYPKGPAADGMIRHPDYGKGANIIQVSDEFKSKPGEKVIIHNVARIYSQPIMGNAKAKDQKTGLDRFNMEVGYDAARIPPITSEGKLDDKKSVLNFRDQGLKEASSWARRTTEGLINAHLYGIKTPYNTAVLDRLNLPHDLTTVFGNDVVEFDANHIMYTKSHSTDAQVAADTTAVLTADFLDQLETKVTEDLDIPLESIDGEDNLLVVVNGRGVEQLRADADYRDAVRQYDGPLNAILKRKLVKYGKFIFLEYANTFQPAANVGRMLVLGQNALQFLKTMDWEWWEGVDDTHDWFGLISVAAMMGAKATSFNGERRNSFAVDYYQRA